MENIYQFSLAQIVTFGLILLRMTAFVFTWPVFGTNSVPSSIKILLGLALTFVLFPIVGFDHVPKNPGLETLITLAARELIVGLTLGYFSRLFFFAVGIAGQIMSVSIGLSTAQLFNPAINEQSTAIEQFHLILATLFFLSIQGHHMLLTALYKSYDFAPLSTTWFSVAAFSNLGSLVQEIMVMGIKLAAPVLIAILFVNLTMAVLGRAVPQMNVLITSMPVNVLAGVFLIFATIPLMIWQMDNLTQETVAKLFQMLKSF